MATYRGPRTANREGSDDMNLGPLEITMIILVILLLFGAKKLPELARGSGRALRIFKAETKGLMDDDESAQGKDRKKDTDVASEVEQPREIEGPRSPMRTDSVRTDVYDDRPGDQR
jgi:sec-independent protein translocase protein TatA